MSWVGPDNPIWRAEGKDRYDAVEDSYSYYHQFFNHRHQSRFVSDVAILFIFGYSFPTLQLNHGL